MVAVLICFRSAEELRAVNVTKDKQNDPLDTVVLDDFYAKQNTRHRFRIHAPSLLVEGLFASMCR